MPELKKDLYTALAEVMFKYRDYPITEEDLKKLMNTVIDEFFESGADE